MRAYTYMSKQEMNNDNNITPLMEQEFAIVDSIARELDINEEDALTLFYQSRVYQMLKNPRYGLQIMSDLYVLDEFMMELRGE